jgi:hypothetical protein
VQRHDSRSLRRRDLDHAGGVPMTTHRWSSEGVNADDVRRALQLLNAVKSSEATNLATYQLGKCHIELFDGSLPTLLISGPTEVSVGNAAGRLGYLDTDGTVTEVKDEVRAGGR